MADPSKKWILNFHGIGECIRPFEPGEGKVWISESKFFSILDRVSDFPDIEITFDDGNSSDALIALPALTKRNLKASFFVPVGKISQKGFMCEEQICGLHSQGMKIGSHGWSHQSWRGLSKAEAQRELVDSRKVLESLLGTEVHAAACPFGDYDRMVFKRVRSAGYTCAYTSDRGFSPHNNFLRARNTVISSASVDDVFSERADCRFSLIDMARRIVKRIR